MALIGDYIHYKIDNYRKYGTYRPDMSNDGSSYSSAQSIYNEQHQKILNTIKSSNTSMSNLQQLSVQLTQLIYGNPSLSNANNEIFQKFRDTIERIFSEKFSNFGINWETGMTVYPKLSTIKDKSFNKDRLERYINKLNQEMNRLSSGLTSLKSSHSLNQIASTIEELERCLQDIENNNEYIENITISDNLLNNINMALTAETLPMSLAIGDIFEDFLGVAQYVLSGKIDTVTDDLIKESIVGTSGKSVVTIDQSKFSSEFVKFDSSGDLYVTDDLKYKIQSNVTQDKLDVIFDWNGDQLNITAKNYKLADSSSMIHLVSGTSLLYLIQNENPHFVNHWLNLMSGASRKSKYLDNLQEAHLAMKITIFAKALTGQGLGRTGEADTFVLNWRSRRIVYVLPVNRIIATAAKDLDGCVKITGYPSAGIGSSWVGSKEFDMGNAMQRITALLGKIRASKITVQIKQQAITGSVSI